MKMREFKNYEKACAYRDRVDGIIQWSTIRGVQYWTVFW